MSKKMFIDNYEIMDELGKGAFSVVRKCMKKADETFYAVKMVNVERIKHSNKEKLEIEARICQKLNHPNIIHLFEVIEESKMWYFVFELITGGELFDDIVKRERYSEFDASFIIQQILGSIVYCHENKIIHRDIKPENLLLLSNKENSPIKLVDFGLAIEMKRDEDALYGFAGTPGYMSPELVRKEPYGKKIDVWAAGVILYILMVGYNPFWDEDLNKLYNHIKYDDLVFLEEDWENLSEEVKDLVSKMMEKNATKRISAAEALNHKWIRDREKMALTIHRGKTIASLKRFNARRKLKGAILTTLFSAKLSNAALTFGSNRGNKNSDNNDSDNMSHSDPPFPQDVESKQKYDMVTVDEIINITDQFIHSLISLDDSKLEEFCDSSMTMFDSSIVGSLILGADLIKFKCQHSKIRPTKSVMFQPHVILFSNDAASISLVRICEFSDGTDVFINQSQETYIWQKKMKNWRIVHIHRTFNSDQEKSRKFNL